ncbi:hypothetical protein M406DRAFT_73704 [Cryphonectria parasitica EP155]|uniref:Uncharacterized protein n=1 Tax=Cryphonectria parasitica (strain ATCC 38755 / EP155) TaxID=660469 RepID=A0A9P4XY35_CRYP1|nr:uncharacterized protein M406DRAFT_73704 [Cryphonectria parasitica EP155]KAF3763051.1 hypothetical protein M406DRAFT_73704 [Cryphonectria parasitica EP155]
MATAPAASAQAGLLLGGKFGKEGENTPPAPGAILANTITLPDGFTCVSPDDMYRINELAPGRREPRFPGIHNLSESVISRTVHPPPFQGEESKRRAQIWDTTARAVREALAGIPAGSHINICANSGPPNDKLEKQAPWAAVPGAAMGLLLVAQFRDTIHPGWQQIAVPIQHNEGRLLAGLRLLPAVTGRRDLTFILTNLTHPTIPAHQMNTVRDHPFLTYGALANSWKATNFGCWFHHGCVFEGEADAIRASFAWDGDLYGWDEAVAYTRRPVVIVTGAKPLRRFDYWQPATVYRGVTWLQMVDGVLCGGYQEMTTRAHVVAWDKTGIPGGPLTGMLPMSSGGAVNAINGGFDGCGTSFTNGSSNVNGNAAW